jgi:hypothetical protein
MDLAEGSDPVGNGGHGSSLRGLSVVEDGAIVEDEGALTLD